nr:hypothetical protein [Bacillus sp. mrc49]
MYHANGTTIPRDSSFRLNTELRSNESTSNQATYYFLPMITERKGPSCRHVYR